MQQSEYSYLECPQEASSIQHQSNYVYKVVGEKRYRKIFYHVTFDQYELDRLKEFDELVQKKGIKLPDDWTQTDSIKIIYNAKMKVKDSIEKLQAHLQWRGNQIFHQQNPQIMDFLTKGILYTFGRDKQYRPVIYLEAFRIETKKHTKEFMILVLSYFLGFVKKHMLLPGHVENWIFIIQTNDVGVFSLPTGGLGDIIKNMSLHFVGHLQRMYVLNPSTGLNLLWKTGAAFMDDEAKSKNVFLKQNQLNMLQQDIPANQLEQKYGGTQPNLTQFWPPSVPK